MSDLQKAKEEYYDFIKIHGVKVARDYITELEKDNQCLKGFIVEQDRTVKELKKTIGEMDGVLIDDFKAMFDIWDNGTSGEREDTLEIMIDKSQEILEKYHGKPIEEIIKS